VLADGEAGPGMEVGEGSGAHVSLKISAPCLPL
jgi:hypothetical protein